MVRLGHTWSYTENTLIPRMLPVWLPGRMGWPTSMRLDRVLIHGRGLETDSTTARLFANRPIRREGVGGGGGEGRQQETDASKEGVPVYLYQSDHYGIVINIPIDVAPPQMSSAVAAVAAEAEATAAATARERAIGWYCWVLGGRVGVRGVGSIALAGLMLFLAVRKLSMRM